MEESGNEIAFISNAFDANLLYCGYKLNYGTMIKERCQDETGPAVGGEEWAVVGVPPFGDNFFSNSRQCNISSARCCKFVKGFHTM